MSQRWEKLGAVARGGTVLAVGAGAAGELWALTPAGAWRGGPAAWRPALDGGRPLLASAVAPGLGGGGFIAAGGAAGGARYSPDDGRSWHDAWDDGAGSPLTCVAVSPPDAEALTLLAGTASAGALRSADGGRRWALVNVGLQDYTVLALAAAPSWAGRELAFAATGDGVYRSPNGGRAWKRAGRGTEGRFVQALALSPRFAVDSTLVAGCDDGQLLRSRDAGETWEPLGAPTAGQPVNALCWQPGGVLAAGLGDGRVLRSDDAGESWAASDLGAPLLALAWCAGALYAGLDDAGLLRSDDGGATWRPDDLLAARDLTRLAVRGGRALAFGPTGGLWARAGGDWAPAAQPPLDEPLAALASGGGRWFAAGGGRVLASGDLAGWEDLAELPAGVTALAPDDRDPSLLWAATEAGELWRIGAGGAAWRAPGELPGGMAPVALAVSGGAPAVAAVDQAAGRGGVWRLEGGRLRPWLACETEWASAQLLLAERAGEPDLAAVGAAVWRRAGEGWEAAQLDGSPVARVLRAWGGLAAVTERGGLFTSEDGAAWRDRGLAAPEGGLLDAAPDGDSLLAIGPGGALWRCGPPT